MTIHPDNILASTLPHPRAGRRREPGHSAPMVKRKPPPVPMIEGWFPPPEGTLELNVGRQPNGYTCGTEVFLAVCELLRLPLRDPDDDSIVDYSAMLKTSAQWGTDPEELVRVARGYLKLRARIESGLSLERLAALVNPAQPYIRRLQDGAPIDRFLDVVMVTYQAYIDPHRTHSWYYPRGREQALKHHTAKLLPVRARGAVLWENDWEDGHWSAVVRVVLPSERELLEAIARRFDAKHRDAIRGGLVLLGDPSNGEGLRFIPAGEFMSRWHDSDRHDNPRFLHTAVVFTADRRKLGEMRRRAAKRRTPMFATAKRNEVLYLP